MTKMAFPFTLLYAVVCAVGGVLGYVNKQSSASLIAGLASAALLALGAVMGCRGKLWGPIVALVVSVALVGRFAKGAFGSPVQIWPAGVMVVLGLATAILLVLAIVAIRRRA